MMGEVAPVLDREGAAEWAARARRNGRSVALANGCFDLLHVGHVRYLHAARAEADLLIVGINADASVAAAKGRGRPLFSAHQRAAVVAALESVDAVTVFDEATADELILAVRPNVHCKGPEYAGGVPEADSVARVGGRVALVGGPKSHGTRDLIDTIRRGGS